MTYDRYCEYEECCRCNERYLQKRIDTLHNVLTLATEIMTTEQVTEFLNRIYTWKEGKGEWNRKK